MEQIKHKGKTNFATSVVLLIIISFDFIWGGKLKDASQMYLFETLPVIVNSSMILIVAINAGFIKSRIQPLFIKAALWVMFLLFCLIQ